MTMQVDAGPRPSLRTQLLGGLTVAVLTAGAWFAWMGWDNEYQIDPQTLSASGPYEAWQVIGCAVSLLIVLISALLLRVRWYAAATAMTLAFTAAWTITAATNDDSGMYLVGTILVLFGLAAGTTVVSLLVTALRPAPQEAAGR